MENDRFKNVKRLFDDYVEGQGAVGACAAVYKDSEELLFYETGYADREKGMKMTRNTIFRCFSMTKPVTSAAMMILLERGMIDIYDPVSKYLPEFAVENMKVVTKNGIVPASAQISLHNLMNMTSGLVYPDPGTEAGDRMKELFDEVESGYDCKKRISTREFVRRIAEKPLAFEPGEHWMYGSGADVVGAVIEQASGMRFGEFLEKEIFKPLGMEDTGFFVPDDKKDRFAQLYDYNEEKGCFEIFKERRLGMEGYDTKPEFESGGAGLVSTVADYSRFARMLANGGTFDGVRILSPDMLRYMGSSQLEEKHAPDLVWPTFRGYGYGNLCRVARRPERSGCCVKAGSFGWDGWTGNYFIVDPETHMVVMYVIQRCAGTDDRLIRRLLNTVYGAM